MSGMVANQYRMDVVKRQAWSEEQLDGLSRALDGLLDAFEGGAWKGGTSDQARGEFGDMRASILSMIGHLREQYAQTASVQPILVPDGSRESTWVSY